MLPCGISAIGDLDWIGELEMGMDRNVYQMSVC